MFSKICIYTKVDILMNIVLDSKLEYEKFTKIYNPLYKVVKSTPYKVVVFSFRNEK